MEQTANRAVRPHSLILDGRSSAKVAGVMAVSCFNEREIVMETSEGEIALLGKGLHIEQLDLDQGELSVTGEIAGVEYNGPVREKEHRRLFARRKKGT